jgi:hypothetical protein
MACGSGHASNAPFLMKKRDCPKNFFHSGFQVEKRSSPFLIETMAGGSAKKKGNFISAASLLENYISRSFLSIIGTIIVPSPKF